jgi:hypothetical protein
MKIQCPCGAKYEIDVTPGMAPVQFVCQNCGQDYSAFVNDLIRRELNEGLPVATLASPAQPTVPPPPRPTISVRATAPPPTSAAPVPIPPPPPTGSRLKISAAQTPTESQSAAAPVAAMCPKHREPTTEQCFVCKKPICPKCMQMFGFFCSPFCKNKAADLKLDIPVFEGRGDLVEKRFWRKVGTIFAVVGTAIVLFLGVWTWYAWFAAVPHTVFSVKFDDISHSGATFVVSNQLVLLHGGTLARYDLNSKKEIWSEDLVTKQQIDDAMKREDEAEAKIEAEYGKPEYSMNELPGLREKLTRIALEEGLSLYLAGKNIWISRDGEERTDAQTNDLQDILLTRYDWDSGKIAQQITVTLTNSVGEFVPRTNELVLAVRSQDDSIVPYEMHVNLLTGETQTKELPGLKPKSPAMVAQNGAALPKFGAGKNFRSSQSQGGGLPVSPYGDASQPLNPQKIQQQAQNSTLPGKIALPAVIAGNEHQQQIFKELNSGNPKPPGAPQIPDEDFMTIPDGGGALQFNEQLVEKNLVEREAMKAPPKKTVMDSGNLTVANEGDALNEQLNEMQRNVSSTVTEDDSIYQVTVRRAGAPDTTFTTNIVGEPQLFPLKTVNVIAGNKTIIVLDKSNKKLWQAETAYNIPGGPGAFLNADSGLSRGPCVERDGMLYVYDEATLTAFDISNGNVRWRLPSVGIAGLFFDDQGMLYVDTSTASLDSVKYSKQIDLNNPAESVLVKVDPKTGQTLWSVKPRGSVAYMSGKYIYTFTEFDPGDSDEQNDPSGVYRPPFLCIQRLNPKNGKVMWEYTDDHAPVDVQYDRNNIRIVYKKEVRLLHYLSF